MMTAQIPLGSGFGANATPDEVMAGIDLAGKVAIVTGGHAGIGLETTRALAKAGARVVVGARDVVRAQQCLEGVAGAETLPLDLADPASIDAFASTCLRAHGVCDLLVGNAGIMATPLMRDARGYELQFATNHLGHFQLTLRLWEALAAAGTARVVVLSSLGHRFAAVDFDDPNFLRRPYDPWLAYGQSKTANALFAVHLDRLGAHRGVRAFAVHPGRIPATGLGRFMPLHEDQAVVRRVASGADYVPAPVKTIAQGAATSLWAATSPLLAGDGGVYCADCDIAPLVDGDSPAPNGVRPWAIDPDQAARLWDLSLALIG